MDKKKGHPVIWMPFPGSLADEPCLARPGDPEARVPRIRVASGASFHGLSITAPPARMPKRILTEARVM